MKRAVLFLLCVSCADVLDIRTSRYLATDCTGTIRVRVIADLSGPTQDVGKPGGKGVYDHLRALGSIRGCPVEAQMVDMKYDVETTLAAYKTWSQQPEWGEVSTIFGQGTAMTQALAAPAANEGKVIVTTAFPGELAAPEPIEHDVGVPSLSGTFAEATVPVRKRSPGYPFVFFSGTDYTTAARIAMSFVWKRGAKRVGFASCTTSAFCTDPVDGAKTFLPVLGTTKGGRDLAIELADDDATVAQKVDAYFQAEVDHKAADASYEPVDWLWFGNTRTTAAKVGRALAATKAKLGIDVQVIANHFSLDELLAAECGDACNGFFGVVPSPVFGDATVAGMDGVLAVHHDFRIADGEPDTALRTLSYVNGYIAVSTWRVAVESVLDGGKPVTGANIRAALETFQQKSVDGLATVSYSPADHRPQSSARIYTLATSGKLDPVGQPLSVALDRNWLGW